MKPWGHYDLVLKFIQIRQINSTLKIFAREIHLSYFSTILFFINIIGLCSSYYRCYWRRGNSWFKWKTNSRVSRSAYKCHQSIKKRFTPCCEPGIKCTHSKLGFIIFHLLKYYNWKFYLCKNYDVLGKPKIFMSMKEEGMKHSFFPAPLLWGLT